MFNKNLWAKINALTQRVQTLELENKTLRQQVGWLESKFPTEYRVVTKDDPVFLTKKSETKWYVKRNTRGKIDYAGPFDTEGCAKKVNASNATAYRWFDHLYDYEKEYYYLQQMQQRSLQSLMGRW